MASSVFTRPRARSPLAAISSQQVFREVKTENELRSAVSLTNYIPSVSGIRVVIANPIGIKSPVVVWGQGILIEGHGKNAIFPLSDSMDCLFDLSQNSFFVTIKSLTFSNPNKVINPVSAIKSYGFGAGYLSVTDCYFDSAASYAVDAGLNSIIYGNRIFGSNILLSGEGCNVFGNFVFGQIIAASTSGNNSISMNNMSGLNIDTSASLGGNSIVGNTNVGTIANTATDAVTSNT